MTIDELQIAFRTPRASATRGPEGRRCPLCVHDASEHKKGKCAGQVWEAGTYEGVAHAKYDYAAEMGEGRSECPCPFDHRQACAPTVSKAMAKDHRAG